MLRSSILCSLSRCPFETCLTLETSSHRFTRLSYISEKRISNLKFNSIEEKRRDTGIDVNYVRSNMRAKHVDTDEGSVSISFYFASCLTKFLFLWKQFLRTPWGFISSFLEISFLNLLAELCYVIFITRRLGLSSRFVPFWYKARGAMKSFKRTLLSLL